MKSPFTAFTRLLLLALALGTSFTSHAQITYSQVPLTAASFTADVVANGAAASPATASTTADVDGAGYYLISQDFYTATTAHTSGIPNNGAIQNTIVGPAALTYQLASLSANNSLRMSGTAGGTITFATPTAATEVNVLGISGGAASTVSMTVTYSDGTTTLFAGQTYPDWFTVDATRNVFGTSGRASATVPVSATAANNTAPFLSQVKLTIPGNKVATNITGITFANTGGVLNIMAVSIGVAPPCTAPPTNLTTVASTTSAGGTALTSACPGASIYLSVSGVPTTSGGYTYQWQSSTTSATAGFTNIAGATNSTYTASQTVATYYRALVSCFFSTATATAATAVQVTQSPFLTCYCTPTYSSGGVNDNITRVQLGTLDNPTTGNASPYYRDYSSAQTGTGATLQIPTLTAGTTVTASLTFGSDPNQYNAIWIDFNQNGTFETTEYFAGPKGTGNSTVTVSIVVPNTAIAGQTKMRVRGGDDVQPTNAQACGASSSNFGEAEDYLVNIVPGCTPTTATFSYGSTTSYCVSGTTNPTVTLASGATAGTFTSTTGLTINATTGAITLGSSTPGIYTVTNTVAATGTTCASSATTSVTITAAPTANFSYPSGTTCVSNTTLTPTLATGATAGTFTLPAAAGLSINATTGVVTVTSTATAGTYTVTNTVAAANGCAAVTSTATFALTTGASSAFSYPTGPYCTSGATNPTPTVTGTAGGTFSSTTGLSINATTGVITLGSSTAGTYTVTYTVTGTCGTSSTTQSIIINAAPTAGFSYPTATTCAGTATTKTPTLATGATAGTFTLPAATGLSINATTGVVTVTSAATAGTYTVTNTVAAANGCAAVTSTATFTITPQTTATFSYGSLPFCTSGTTTPTPTITGTAGGTFSSTTGLSLNATTGAITLSSSTPGTYTVTYTVAGTCGSSGTQAVTINTPPTAGFSLPTATNCAGTATTLTPTLATGASAGTYSLPVATGLSINATTGVVTVTSAATAGTYTVTNTVTSGGCAAVTSTATFIITPQTTATFSYAGSPYCTTGTTVTPTITGTAGGTFSSTTGLSLNATTGAITLSTSTPGTYTVTYTVAGPCGSSGTQTVTITAPQTANFSYATPAPGTACAGSTSTFTAVLATGAAAGTFSISPASGLAINATTGTLSLTGALAGTYTITNTVAASGGCAASTSTATFAVSSLPATPTLVASGTPATGITLTSTNITGNQFYLNGVAIPGATGASYLVNSGTNNGSYTVVVTNAAGCSSAPSAPVTVTVTAATPATAGTRLTLYPNPTRDGLLTLELGGYQQAVQLSVVNALGQRVFETTVSGAGLTQKQTLNLSGLATGVYLLQARTASGSLETRRFVRE